MKRNNHEVNRLVNYAKKATPEELMDDYGIEILENGKIYDPVEDMTFNNLAEWAEDVVSYDIEDDYDIKKSNKYDEEDY
jgi:hypothetical protein